MEGVIDHVVICHDGNLVIIEDENGQQYAFACDDPEGTYPVGTTLLPEDFRVARRLSAGGAYEV